MRWLYCLPPVDFSSRFEVSICYCDWQGEFIFLRRQLNTSQGGAWTAPGGKLEAGESPLLAAIREVREETNIALLPEQLEPRGSYFSRIPNLDYIIHLFIAKLRQPPIVRLSEREHSEYVWTTIEKASALPLVLAGDECLCAAFNLQQRVSNGDDCISENSFFLS